MLLSVNHSFGQIHFDLITRYMFDTAFLFQVVRDGIAKNDKLNQRSDCVIYPIYRFEDATPHTKEDFLSGAFLNTFTPLHHMPSEYWLSISQKRSGWLSICDRIIILSADGDYLGEADPYFFYCYNVCEDDSVEILIPDAALSDLLYNHVFDYIFSTTEYRSFDKTRIYYGVKKKDRRVDVIFYTFYGVKIMSMEEVVNDYWDEFCHESTTLLKEIYEEKKHSFDSVMKDVPYNICY